MTKRQTANPIAMPKKRVVRKTAPNGTTYVYYTLRAYRNVHGQPTSDTACIGKLSEDKSSLIPNPRYFEIFPDAIDSKDCDIELVRSWGLSFALTALAERIGLSDILKMVFPSRHEEILTAAMYMVACGNVMSYIAEWLSDNDAPCSSLSSQSVSRLFSSITPSERMGFFKHWNKRYADESHILYDVTSVSTYSDSLENAEWGHNRDNESLAQLNLGMFYGVFCELPLYYTLYNGSIADKSSFPCMMGDAAELGIKDAEFVFDKGFVTEPNLARVAKAGLRFVAPCPPSRKDAQALLAEVGDKVKEPVNWIGEESCYGMKARFVLLGRVLFAHIFYDSARFAEHERMLYTHVDRLQKELEGLIKARVPKRYRDFFDLKETKAGKLTGFSRNEEAFAKALSVAGFVVFLTNNEKLTPIDVLHLYRRRDDIEKAFCDLKNAVDFKRLRTHSQPSTDGKTFVGFIALVLRSHIIKLLQNNEGTKDMTRKKALLELSKCRYAITSSGQKRCLPITKTQRIISEALGVSLV